MWDSAGSRSAPRRRKNLEAENMDMVKTSRSGNYKLAHWKESQKGLKLKGIQKKEGKKKRKGRRKEGERGRVELEGKYMLCVSFFGIRHVELRLVPSNVLPLWLIGLIGLTGVSMGQAVCQAVLQMQIGGNFTRLLGVDSQISNWIQRDAGNAG